MFDFDKEYEAMMLANTEEKDIEFQRNLFGLEQWWFIPIGPEKQWQPLHGNVNGVPTFIAFTDTARALAFGKERGFIHEGDKTLMMSIPPSFLANMANFYVRGGIQNILINTKWNVPLKTLRLKYYEIMKPYNFVELYQRICKGDKEGLREFLSALFMLPLWYFIREKGHEYISYELIETEGRQEILSYLQLRSAMHFEDLAKKTKPNSEMIYFEPPDAMIFLNEISRDAQITWVQFWDQLNDGQIAMYSIQLSELNEFYKSNANSLKHLWMSG